MAEQFCVNRRLYITVFREFKESKEKLVSADFQQLQTAVYKILVLRTECERKFRGVNFFMSPQRETLQRDHLSTFLFIKLRGGVPATVNIQSQRICEDMVS